MDMINLKNLYTGKKLIKEIVERNESEKNPWSKKGHEKFLKSNKNLKRK